MTATMSETHEARAADLVAEFTSVGIPAEIGAYTGDPVGSRTTVLVRTGAKPAQLGIEVSDAFRWQVPRFTHVHEMNLETPVAEVTELFALCFAGRCADLGKLLATTNEED